MYDHIFIVYLEPLSLCTKAVFVLQKNREQVQVKYFMS